MGTDASVLHCPNCGAPAAADDTSCQYCHSALATVSCPKCFERLFDGMAYCPHCGARRARSAGGNRTAPCPACRAAGGMMREVLLGDTDLLECDRCHATWVDADAFERICADRATQTAVLQRWPSPPAAPGPVVYRRCLVCGQMMNRLNFGRLSGTVIDVCKGHGTFLDAGELHQIAVFIQGGGLDRARQQQIEDLRDAEAQLRAAQDTAGGASIGGSSVITWSHSSWEGPSLVEVLRSIKRDS